MKKLDNKTFYTKLDKSKTENMVKAAYAELFKIDLDDSDFIDLYTPSVLFEFKEDKNFKNVKALATILAQSLYYAHKLKFDFTDKLLSPYICLADKNEAVITETAIWTNYYSNTEKYDWDLAPSNPDPKLVKDLIVDMSFRYLKIYSIREASDFDAFSEKLTRLLNPQTVLVLKDKKVITESNFEDVYHLWASKFGVDVKNGSKPARYFLADIQEGNTVVMKDQNKVLFRIEAGKFVEKRILNKKYEEFWNLYDRVSSPDTLRGILTKVDRINDDFKRRFEGEFFTPLPFAKKGLEYIEKTIGKQWWKKGYKLWDMAAGTGNLEYHLPAEAYEHLYLSSLHPDDVDYCKTVFPAATCFQYDYLNDDIEHLKTKEELVLFGKENIFTPQYKMPLSLQKDLANPTNKWIILMNPPFATAQTAGAKGDSKKDVSDTKVRKLMHRDDLGEVSRELFAQFLYRIKYEFKGKEAHLGLFSKLKYVNANNDQKFRDKVFQFSFEHGFMFSSVNFSGTSRASQFPVGFLLWHLNDAKSIESQTIELDVFDTKVQKIEVKEILVEHRDKFLSKWIDRPAGTTKFPPVGSSINLKFDNKDPRDRISENFIASLMCCGNDPQHQNFTALLSMPYVSAGSFSVEPNNFEKAMVIHAVRRIPKATWTNDRDQFLIPKENVTDEFTNDCVIWSLFSNSNETVSMKNVVYLSKTYQIQNHFFPFVLKELKKWKITDSDIGLTMTQADDRFVAAWLEKHPLSTEAQNVLDAGRKVYQYYFAQLNQLDLTKYKIAAWDAGWWQIKNALNDQILGEDVLQQVKICQDVLKNKIEPLIYEYGFLSK